MRRKIITTVVAVAIIGPFAWVATVDAVSIKHTKNQQSQHIQQLSIESEKLDTQIQKTEEVKTQIVEEISQSEQEKNNAVKERKKLEAELGAN